MKDKQSLLRNIATLTATLAPLSANYQSIVDKAVDDKGQPRAFTHDEWSNHEGMARDISALTEQIALNRSLIKAHEISDAADNETARALGLSSASQIVNSTEKYTEQFCQFLKAGATESAMNSAFDADSLRNLSTLTGPQGGVLIPTVLEKAILLEAFSQSPLLVMSTVQMTTILKSQIPFMGPIGLLAPRREMEVYLKTEPALSVKSVDIFNFGGMFPISQELMADAEGLDSAFVQVWAEALAETVEEYGLKGTSGTTAFFDQAGSAATVTLAGRVPPGILSNGSTIVPIHVNSSATAITADDIINLKQKVKPSARQGGSYLISSDFETKALLLKDTTGAPLWRQNLILGQPSLLNGSEYRVSDRMDAVTASKTPALFGDFKRGHQIVIRKGLTIETSGHYLFGNGAVAVKGDVRMGALVKYANLLARLNTPAS